jgi:hypothetical protein
MEIWIARRRKTEPVNLRAQILQPKRKPAAFKTGMTGNQDAFATVKIIEHFWDAAAIEHL